MAGGGSWFVNTAFNGSFRYIPVLGCALLNQMALASDNKTYDVVVAGRKCTDENQQITCEYHVGSSLHFAVVALGTPEMAVTFFKADWDGDYYASYGFLHGCIIVKPGLKAPPSTLPMFAFVSPKNGKVYPDWRMCRDGF
jgi:hypothetical protein